MDRLNPKVSCLLPTLPSCDGATLAWPPLTLEPAHPRTLRLAAFKTQGTHDGPQEENPPFITLGIRRIGFTTKKISLSKYSY